MFHSAPVNNEWVRLAVGDSIARIDVQRGFDAVHTLDVSMSLLIESTSDNTKDSILLGNTSGWWLELNRLGVVNATYGSVALEVTTKRNVTSKTAFYPGDARGVFAGRRFNVRAIDNAETLRVFLNGVEGSISQEWDVAQANPFTIVSGSPLSVGTYDAGHAAIYSEINMKLYELAISTNGELVCHIRPKVYMENNARNADGTFSIPDISGNGNDLIISGDNFYFGRGWSRARPYSGRETLR